MLTFAGNWTQIGYGVNSTCAESTARNFGEVNWVQHASYDSTTGDIYVIGEFINGINPDHTLIPVGGLATFHASSKTWSGIANGIKMCAPQSNPIGWLLGVSVESFSSLVVIGGPLVPQDPNFSCDKHNVGVYIYDRGARQWTELPQIYSYPDYNSQCNAAVAVMKFLGNYKGLNIPSSRLIAAALSFTETYFMNIPGLTIMTAMSFIGNDVWIAGFNDGQEALDWPTSVLYCPNCNT